MLDQVVFVEGGRSEFRGEMLDRFMNFTETGGVNFGRRCWIDLWISQRIVFQNSI